MKKIFVVSDGTGRTAEQTLMAALTQFPSIDADIILKGEVRTEQQIEEIVKEAVGVKGIIIHTLVSSTLRENILRISRIHNIDSIDLMGPLLSRLAHHFADSPTGEPGLFFHLNKEYFKRIDAMQFAFIHDDGQRYYEYDTAEILLVGVSRTFKTPLSIYLAFKGWFVANYPIVPGVELPEIMNKLPAGNVFGLMTQPQDLSNLREARQPYLGGSTAEYSSLDNVRRELNYAQNLFKRYEWPVIQVTNKPIEEIASEILTIKRRIHQPERIKRKTPPAAANHKNLK
ncbi:MAG: kinase/pyrophosphorylase [Bacteroidales bacterium]|nr:kinase/pyrophosphorylase [Bacteroidales bacterium]